MQITRTVQVEKMFKAVKTHLLCYALNLHFNVNESVDFKRYRSSMQSVFSVFGKANILGLGNARARFWDHNKE